MNEYKLMKVLHIVTWYSSRQDKNLFTGVFHNELAKAQETKCETAIWYPYDNSLKHELLVGVEWDVLTFRSNLSLNKPLQLYICKKQFKQIIARFKPDIIHAHVGRRAGFIAVILGKTFGIPVLVNEHEPIELMDLNKLKNRLRQNYTYSHSVINICVSDYLNSELSVRYPKCKFTTIYNGVFDPLTFVSESDPDYYVESYINAVIVSGFYDKDIKGFQYLLPALKEVNNFNDTKVFLHVCGDGEYLEYYKNLSEEIGISDFCRFYGHCDKKQVFQIVNQMDFGISASLFESAGVSIEEMLLLGKPVVVTRSGGASSLVSVDNSIVVDKASSEQLVEGIEKMSKMYLNFSHDLIREKAIEMFEMYSIVDKFVNLYSEMIK